MARRPTIIDVARLAGVSKSTVARVINGNDGAVREETRRRVLAAADQLGYERNAVAGSLRTDQTFIVALSIPDITNPFWPEVARGVQDTIEASGYTTVTFNSDWKVDREQHFLTTVRRSRFDGLVINPTTATNAELVGLGIPVVILGGGDSYPDFDSVGSDTERGAQEALAYLHGLGHVRIGLIAGRSARSKTFVRYQSYVAFHARKGIPLDDALVVDCDFSDQAGFEAMKRLLSLPEPPSAVFAANDILAIGALKAAQAMRRRVPEDVSIVGMDDIYAAATTSPALTTVAKRKYETGATAAQFLVSRMCGEAPETPRRVKLPCRLVVRESTGVVRQVRDHAAT
ncbi:MAG: LacI family transcriptional regulator [Anaerolineae bacterium]|nr:LacI family transcriptional regulator [Anaerolineae bacterium]